MTDPTERTAAALRARRLISEQNLQRVADALRQMQQEHVPITVAAVARQGRVSRTFLYQNADARRLVAAAAEATHRDQTSRRHEQAHRIEASWRERALNAEQELRLAHDEIIQQRGRIGELLGRIRDLEGDLPPDGVQQLLSEVHTLKTQTRQLNQENRRLEERLVGARDNNRFLDKRLAALEADLIHAHFEGALNRDRAAD